MYKSLNPNLIAISGRQSELIELAMTYGFKGLVIDAADTAKRVKRTDFDYASRYLRSAEIKISGFELPIDLDADEESFGKSMANLQDVIEVAAKVKAVLGSLRVPAATDRLPYHEYFEVQRRRVASIGEAMEKAGLKLGLYFSPAAEMRADKQFKFAADTEGFLAFLNAVKSKSVGITLDTWAWTVGGGSVRELKDLPADGVVTVRLSDASLELAVDKASVKDRLMPGEDQLVKNAEICKHLYAAGYRGPVSAGCHPSTIAGMTRDAIVQHTQDCLDKVLEAAEVPYETRKPEMFVDLDVGNYAAAE